MTFAERITECNAHDLARYVPLEVGGVAVGAVRADRLALLREVTGVCVEGVGDEGRPAAAARVTIDGADVDARTEVLDRALTHVIEQGGGISGRFGELFPVTVSFEGEVLALVDRAAIPWWGASAFGVHVNGFVRRHDGLHMWIAHRAQDRANHAGMLDNVVAGGQPHGISPADNVAKECGEEAGIPEPLARTARPVGVVSYCAEHDRGLKPDTMFCYDLELPADFVPQAVDGEVERFELLPLDEVAAIVRDTQRFKFNCNLVIIDFLVRHGWLGPEDPDYTAICDGLHQPLDRSRLGRARRDRVPQDRMPRDRAEPA